MMNDELSIANDLTVTDLIGLAALGAFGFGVLLALLLVALMKETEAGSSSSELQTALNAELQTLRVNHEINQISMAAHQAMQHLHSAHVRTAIPVQPITQPTNPSTDTNQVDGDWDFGPGTSAESQAPSSGDWSER